MPSRSPPQRTGSSRERGRRPPPELGAALARLDRARVRARRDLPGLPGDRLRPRRRAAAQLHAAAPALDLLAEDLRQAQNALGDITGQFTTDDLLGEIFSKFCIGK